MKLGDLLRETLEIDSDEVWKNERTPTPVRVFGGRLHSMGLSLREVVAVFERLGVDRSQGAVWNWTHTLSETQADSPTAESSRVVIDENRLLSTVKQKGSMLLPTLTRICCSVSKCSAGAGLDPASAFLHRLTTSHDVSDTEFLVDAAGYLTALARRELSGHLDYNERNLVEKLFRRSRCGSTAFTRFGGGVQPAHGAGYDDSNTITTTTDRIKRLIDERPSRRFSTRHL